MRFLRAFAEFWYDFIVGDDWRIAVAVVVALAATYAVAHATDAPSWWLVPAVVAVVLPLSVRYAARHER